MTASTVESPAPKKKRKAGRNLPAAIGVGVGLGALGLLAIFGARWGWVALATPVILMAVHELRRGFAFGGHAVPAIPVCAGAALMLPVTYLHGAAGLLVVFAVSLGAVIVWRALAGRLRTAIRDIGSGVFILAYAPFLAAFSVLLLTSPLGQQKVVAFVLITVCSDIGGYVAGVRFGSRPMSPTVSPNKSWEGFFGSVITCAVVGAIVLETMIGAPWWTGVLIGAVIASLATLGDLTESMLKRDLGIKDFGNLLPGHGGVMDRLDSLLVCAPAAWIMFRLLLPA